MNHLLILAITLGDPCGCGSEITAKACADPQIYEICRPPIERWCVEKYCEDFYGDGGTLGHMIHCSNIVWPHMEAVSDSFAEGFLTDQCASPAILRASRKIIRPATVKRSQNIKKTANSIFPHAQKYLPRTVCMLKICTRTAVKLSRL